MNELHAGCGLFKEVKGILSDARSNAYATVNFAMVKAYWRVGEAIVAAQGGADRGGYDTGLIKSLSKSLTAEYGKGFTPANLRYMRQFYLTFPMYHTLCDQLSWSHYRLLIGVENPNARKYYLEECAKSNWSVRQLDRQITTFSFERLLSSQNKSLVAAESAGKEAGMKPFDIIKDPYVLEFLGVDHNKDFFESDLEQALLSHIQKFLLELGRGFTFEARQKRISFDGEHYYIDLVFYNYILKCFVLIDLKAGRLKHQDIGQMQMYVNYYTRELMNEGDNPPIGIILCAAKSESVVQYTLPEGQNQIFTSKYKLTLPTESELLAELKAEQELHELSAKDDAVTQE